MFIVLLFCFLIYMFFKIFNFWIENLIVFCGKRYILFVGIVYELFVGILKKVRIVVIVFDCMVEVFWNGGLCFN